MEITLMEHDDLKLALEALDHRLDGVVAVQRFNLGLQTRNRLEASLRPLSRLQTCQIIFGVLMILLGVAVWHGARAPGGLFFCGILLHVYGVLTIAISVIMKVLIGRIDWTGPVLDIQRQLARLHQIHVLSGIVLGLPWCFLWIPVVIALFRVMTGADLYAPMPAIWWWQALGGVVVTTAVWLLYRLARAWGKTGITRAVESSFAGPYLLRAQREFEELRRFECD
jgi:hypothetical protein